MSKGNECDKGLVVLHIIAVNGIGGAEKLLITLLPALEQKGANIHCLLFYGSKYAKEAKSIGTALEEKRITVVLKEYSGIFRKKNFSFILEAIRKQNPSIVHVHLKHAEIWVAVLKALGKIRVPVVSTLHGYRDEYHNAYGLFWNKKAMRTPYYWLSRFTSSQMDRFISISNSIALFFEKSGLIKKENIRTIYHGTDVDDICLLPVKHVQPNFVLIGRLVAFKGHLYALEATKILKEKYPCLQLHFYGTGVLEETLRQAACTFGIGDNVFFHGFVENLKDRLLTHSIALMPSIGEPFGLVFFDAFKAGLPVVAFDLPAGNELIKDSYNGLLAKPLDANSLAEKMEKLLLNDELYQQIRRNAAEVVKADFTIAKMAEKYMAFYFDTKDLAESTQFHLA